MTRIGLNAHHLSFSENYRRAGIYSYIYNLLLWLPKVDPEREYLAFLGDRRARFPGLTQRFSSFPTTMPWLRILWEQWVQPIELNRLGVDLLHSMAFVQPLLIGRPSVITIYDLSFLRFPESFRPLNRLYLKAFTRRSARRSNRIITISESSRKDVVRLLGVPAERVSVVYCGVEETFHPIEDEEALRVFRRRRLLPERFIFFLGTIEPRKNVGALVRAYGRLRRETSLEHHLVVAGAKGWLYEDVFAEVERLGLADRVHFPGYVARDELPYWYSAADAFVYPSRYEGFGIPPLEAMACGTPVVASNASSLPEVIGDAGVLVDPGDEEALAAAISTVLTDRGEAQRLKQLGLARARRFSWFEAARRTADIYGEVLAGEGQE